MKKKEIIMCHTFIGTVPLAVGKKFLFEAEGHPPRQMCIVKDCPEVYMGKFWQPGYAIADYMTGFIVPHSSNIKHNATQGEIVKAFFTKMSEIGMSPNGIAAIAEEADPEDVKWSAADLSSLPCVIKMIVKQIYGVCL